MKFIGTFGSGQLGGFGIHYHVEVEADNETAARLAMSDAFQGKWCGIYSEEFGYPEKYHTRKLGRMVVTEYNYGTDDDYVYYENYLE